MPSVNYNGNIIEVRNTSTLALDPVSEIPADQLFVSEPDEFGSRYAFDVDEIATDFAANNRFLNPHNHQPFSINEIEQILIKSEKARGHARVLLNETSKFLAQFTHETLDEMKLFLANVRRGPETNTASITRQYTEQELKELASADVSPADLARGEAFSRFKDYYAQLTDDEKKAIDEFPGIKETLDFYDLKGSLENIFKVKGDTCLGGTSGAILVIIDAVNLSNSLTDILGRVELNATFSSSAPTKGSQSNHTTIPLSTSASSSTDTALEVTEKFTLDKERDLAFGQIKHAIDRLQIPGIDLEINPGTASTPGKHLRIVGLSSFEFKALANTLKDLGINFQLKHKGNEEMLVISDPNADVTLKRKFTQNLTDSYGQALVSVKNEAAYEQLQHAIKQLQISGVDIEINPGTASTPGQHLRIVGSPSSDLSALTKALKDVGIESQLKHKGNQPMLIITDPNQQVALNFRLNQKVKDSYGLAVNSVQNKAAYQQIQHAINSLEISAIKVEINPGTISIPDQHLRIIGFSHTELTNLSKALNDVGIKTEFNNDTNLKMLVIKDPNADVALKFKFTQILKGAYDKVASSAQNETLPPKINPMK